MTFLELCTKVRQESGVSGTGPASTNVGGTSGILLKIINWTNDAWLAIQSLRQDWDWLWNEDATAATVAGTADYSASDFSVTNLGRWDGETMKIYLTSAGVSTENYLPFKDYQEYKQFYAKGSPDNAFPAFFTILPSGNIRLYPPPDAIYTLTCDYFAMPAKWDVDGTDDAEIPGLPTDMHDAIWAWALIHYAFYDEAITLSASATSRAEFWINKLEGRARPQASMSTKPLA